MTKLFVSYQIALKLKEKGFDEACLGYYNHNAQLRRYMNPDQDWYSFEKQNLKNSKITIPETYSAPLYQQVTDWFRKIHKISITVKHYTSGIFSFEIQKHNGDSTGWTRISAFIEKGFYNEQDALDYAIEEALKLI